MEFGLLGFEGGDGLLTCSDIKELTVSSTIDSLNGGSEVNNQKLFGSGFLKQERSGDNNQEELRGFKMAKTGYDGQQQMLSFSLPNSQAQTIPCYSSNAYSTRPGYSNGGLNAGNTHGMVSGIRGPFTPSQWMELEHQALIYKYITSNVPIPSSLLNPIRKALDSSGFSSILGLRPNALGWGAFHLGFANNSDPEPGRCRRTDGKKWRCSKDAVADQKYCDRHINRGRHRSRKPVEGQPGHSVPGTNKGTTKLPLGSTTSVAVVPGGGTSNTSGIPRHQINSLLPGGSNPSSTLPSFDRNLLDDSNKGERYQDTPNFSIRSPAMSLKDHYFPPKQQNLSEETHRGEFGLVCLDSLLNPLNKSSSIINTSRFGSSEEPKIGGDKFQHQLHPFMNDWPKTSSGSSTISWSNMDVHSDRTQLSISIPVSSDYTSTTSSPNNGKLGTFPLGLFSELEATRVGLGAGSGDGHKHPQANWNSGSWQTPIGGPLGEVLHSTINGTGESKQTSSLNLVTDGSDSRPQMAYSPTGVLQKAALGSVSNSSGGSSPRPESSKGNEAASLCNIFLGSALRNSTRSGL